MVAKHIGVNTFVKVKSNLYTYINLKSTIEKPQLEKVPAICLKS